MKGFSLGVLTALAALTLGGCAGAYVAGDVGPHHRNSTLRLASPPPNVSGR